MLTAMINGESDPLRLADLAKGKMRRKIPDLAQALTGHFDANHAQLAHSMLRLSDRRREWFAAARFDAAPRTGKTAPARVIVMRPGRSGMRTGTFAPVQWRSYIEKRQSLPR
jgi:hypothetical protein